MQTIFITPLRTSVQYLFHINLYSNQRVSEDKGISLNTKLKFFNLKLLV